jgi:hypothetical protein
MTRTIALTALIALGLSGEPVHEPVHARSSHVPHPATVRNIAENALPATSTTTGSTAPSPADKPGHHRRHLAYLPANLCGLDSDTVISKNSGLSRGRTAWLPADGRRRRRLYIRGPGACRTGSRQRPCAGEQQVVRAALDDLAVLKAESPGAGSLPVAPWFSAI